MTALNRRQLLRYGASTLAFASVAGTLPGFVSANDGDSTSGVPGTGGGDADVDLTIQDVDYELIDGSTVFMYAFSLNGAAPRIPGPRAAGPRRSRSRHQADQSQQTAAWFSGAGNGRRRHRDARPQALRKRFQFTAGKAGTYFYLDPMFSPVNRVLGLHGALIVEPDDDSSLRRCEDAVQPRSMRPRPSRTLFNSFGSNFPVSR